MSRSRRQCTNKVAYSTFSKAKRQCLIMKRFQDDILEPYKCNFCGCFHVGHNNGTYEHPKFNRKLRIDMSSPIPVPTDLRANLFPSDHPGKFRACLAWTVGNVEDIGVKSVHLTMADGERMHVYAQSWSFDSVSIDDLDINKTYKFTVQLQAEDGYVSPMSDVLEVSMR